MRSRTYLEKRATSLGKDVLFLYPQLSRSAAFEYSSLRSRRPRVMQGAARSIEKKWEKGSFTHLSPGPIWLACDDELKASMSTDIEYRTTIENQILTSHPRQGATEFRSSA